MKVTGWASRHEMDHFRHVVQPSAFNDSIARRGLQGPRSVKLYLQHDRNKIAGRILKLEARNKGLWIEAEVDESISYASDIAKAIKATGGLSFSVGFYIEDADILPDSNDREYLLIIKGDLEEVSIVPEPGNALAVMESYE